MSHSLKWQQKSGCALSILRLVCVCVEADDMWTWREEVGKGKDWQALQALNALWSSITTI